MLKTHKNNILFAVLSSLLILMVFSACEEVIDLELNDPGFQRIVVEGNITTEYGHQELRLTRTLSYFANELVPPLLNIDAKIVEEGSGLEFPLSLSNDSLGIYQTEEMACKVGETYSLIIDHEGQSYKATSYLDTVPDIDSVSTEYFVFHIFGRIMGQYRVKISLFEPDPEGQIYSMYVYLNDTLYTKEISTMVYFADYQLNNMYWPEFDLFDLAQFSFPQEDIIWDTNTVRLELFSVSQDELLFLNALAAESYGNGSIFSGPPANIPTNVFNATEGIDGVGFFGASDKYVIETTLIKVHNDSTNNDFGRPH